MLMSMRYAENVQHIPDRTHGDGGLESFRLDKKRVYQCYAPQDAFTVAAQTTAQKSKITTDTKKLLDNPALTVSLLPGGYKVKRWVLLTPWCDDKAVLIHAHTRSQYVRAQNPVWAHPDFAIVVCTDRDLFPEQLALLSGANSVIPSLSDEVAELDDADSLAATLEAKLRRNPDLVTSEQILFEYLESLVRDYARGSATMEQLDLSFGMVARDVREIADSILRGLTRRMLGGAGGISDVQTLEDSLRLDIQSAAPSLKPSMVDDLARYFVAKWFVDCPLRFKEVLA